MGNGLAKKKILLIWKWRYLEVLGERCTFRDRERLGSGMRVGFGVDWPLGVEEKLFCVDVLAERYTVFNAEYLFFYERTASLYSVLRQKISLVYILFFGVPSKALHAS